MTTKQKQSLTAEAAYETASLISQDLLGKLAELLQDQPAPGVAEHPIHWGHVGDITHVNKQLNNIVAFLSGKNH